MHLLQSTIYALIRIFDLFVVGWKNYGRDTKTKRENGSNYRAL
jgi:hypothetical protein